MILEDKKKENYIKKIAEICNEKVFTILLISSIFGIIIMLVIGLSDDVNTDAKMTAFGYFAFLMFLFQLDDFLIAVCMLVECLALKKQTKYYIVKASQIKPSP